MNWCLAHPKDVDANTDLLTERTCAYYNTFMATEHGRAVLYDLQRIVYGLDKEDSHTILALQDFVLDIKRRCGVVDVMRVIEAEAKIAEGYEVPKKKEERTNLL